MTDMPVNLQLLRIRVSAVDDLVKRTLSDYCTE